MCARNRDRIAIAGITQPACGRRGRLPGRCTGQKFAAYYAVVSGQPLINGSTIAQVPQDHITYYHIELPAHDVLFAEKLPSETYLDVGDRTNFANSGDPMRLFPDFATISLETQIIWEAKGCAPSSSTAPSSWPPDAISPISQRKQNLAAAA